MGTLVYLERERRNIMSKDRVRAQRQACITAFNL